MANVRRPGGFVLALLVIVPALLLLGVFALVSADTIQDSPIGKILVTRTRPQHPVSVAARGLFTEQESRLKDLDRRIAVAADEDAVLALEREYQQVKLETELSFYQLQLDRAREAGNEEAVQKLETAVTAMQRLIDRGRTPSMSIEEVEHR